MSGKTIIVVYIPRADWLLKQFYGLYYSVACKTDLHEHFDFLVAGPASIREKIPTEHCSFVELDELSKKDEFKYVYSGNGYGYVNSFAPFTDPACIDILSKYDQCLRLDVDTFLCEGILNAQLEEDEIIVGNAAYSSETARIKLPLIMEKMSLPDQNIHNIGSTWLSKTPHMIREGARTIDFVNYFLKNEFDKHEGSWPQWYGGVILLYAGHLALNSSGLKITQTDKLDFFSTSPKDAADFYSIHSWHTDKFFSKHWLMSNRYKDRAPNSDSPQCDEYAFDCAINGIDCFSNLGAKTSEEELFITTTS